MFKYPTDDEELKVCYNDLLNEYPHLLSIDDTHEHELGLLMSKIVYFTKKGTDITELELKIWDSVLKSIKIKMDIIGEKRRYDYMITQQQIKRRELDKDTKRSDFMNLVARIMSVLSEELMPEQMISLTSKLSQLIKETPVL